MTTLMTISLTGIGTILVTVLGGLLLEYIRNYRPEIGTNIKEATPIQLDGKMIGAYVVHIENISSRTLKEISVKIELENGVIRPSGSTTSRGLEYKTENSEKAINISIPYLKKDEFIDVTAIGEAKFFLQAKPNLSVRSPNHFKESSLGSEKSKSSTRFLYAGIVASVVSGIFVGFISTDASMLDQNDYLTIAATENNLPDLAREYADSSSFHYFPQSFRIYSDAKNTKDRKKIESYRNFLLTVINSSTKMVKTSQASYYFNVGRIELLLGQNEDASKHISQAYALDQNLIKTMFDLDPNSKKYFSQQ